MLLVQVCFAQTDTLDVPIDRVVIDSTDKPYGYYIAVPPKGKEIKGTLLLLPGLGQSTEAIFHDSPLYEYAYQNQLLTIGFAARTRITADSLIQQKLNAVLEHVLTQYQVPADKFVLGGFSAGGVVALRYTELCYQFPDRFPIQPQGVFMADSPVDLFQSWMLTEENRKNAHSEIAVQEAEWIKRLYTAYYGTTPGDNPQFFEALSPFSMDKTKGENERFLKDVAIRAYHDVDIAWRLKNRNQTVRCSNYIATSELINRLMLLGNQRAEFVQTFQTGYRKNGNRHPHSWSIIDAPECIQWILTLL